MRGAQPHFYDFPATDAQPKLNLQGTPHKHKLRPAIFPHRGHENQGKTENCSDEGRLKRDKTQRNL